MMQRSGSVRSRQTQPVFGDRLSKLCKLTETNLQLLELQLAADKCHRELSARAEVVDCSVEDSTDDTGQSRKSRWQNLDTIFAGSCSLDREAKSCLPSAGEEPRLSYSDGGSMNSYCYLCTTLEEHRSHLRSTKKVHGKTRRKYQLPASALPLQRPLSAVQLLSSEPDHGPPAPAAGALYKVTIRTGSRGTCIPMSMQIIGSKGRSEVSELRKRARPGFSFMPNSKETFMIRASADLGYLKKLKLVMTGDDDRRTSTGWVVDEIRIANLTKAVSRGASAVSAAYVFIPKRELFAEESSTVEKLDGELVPTATKEYEVSVVTGKLSGCSPDTRVYITLIGSKGRSAKLELKEERQTGDVSFAKGKIESFHIATDDVGTVNKLRIEHDGDLAVRWHLMLIAVHDPTSGRSTVFKCNQVLAEEEGNARWRELHGTRLSGDLRPEKLISKDFERLYELEVHTGSVAFAGTNANVTVQLFGDKDRSTDLLKLPHNSLNNVNAFEKGQIDVFRVTAADVGHVQKLRIGHDNTGLSPGWYLEQVIVRKFSDIAKSEKQAGHIEKSSDKASESEGGSSGTESKSERDSSPDSHHDQTKKKNLSSRRRSKGSPTGDKTTEKEHATGTITADRHTPNLKSLKSGKGEGRFAKWRSGIQKTLIDSDEQDSSELESNLSDGEAKKDPDMRKEIENKKRLYRMYKEVGHARPRIDEYTFVVRRWLAIDVGERQTDIELSVTSERTFEA